MPRMSCSARGALLILQRLVDRNITQVTGSGGQVLISQGWFDYWLHLYRASWQSPRMHGTHTKMKRRVFFVARFIYFDDLWSVFRGISQSNKLNSRADLDKCCQENHTDRSTCFFGTKQKVNATPNTYEKHIYDSHMLALEL